ncbi:hypothetical protein [Phyllobacterium myrsinacearum]|uniref:Urease operon accessory protein n=1 Tax=Phyllobacterium myrsinacearum TaxID=28101 RepID=A0A839EUJ6_9HYPH|nr:hypothetical protein [Phyllobacterium myrsinacearum]MBA8880087.1 hypothetical protein [Phyllobacterium myrsinacearum]
MTKKMYIVGNGPIKEDLSAAIDRSDFVVRFNEPKSSIGMSGTKTDILFMCNAGKPMQRRLADPSFIASPIVRAASQIVLAYHPFIIERYFPKPNILSRIKGRRSDWTMATIRALGGVGKTNIVLPEQFYLDGCRELGLPDSKMAEVFPSTGFFGIYYILNHPDYAGWDISVCGFSWQGWKRHAWANEQEWVKDKVDRKLLSVIDS